MRNWRQPPANEDGGRRDPGGSQRGGHPNRDARDPYDSYGSYGGYDDADDGDAVPRGRQRRGNPGYEEMDLGRALVPQNQGIAPVPPQPGGALAMPGFGQLDDVERAQGIRRPAYIPAMNDKPKVKPATWRVMSGVLSVLLMCVASCAAAGFLGRTAVQRMFPAPIKVLQTPTVIDYSSVPATPAATEGPASTYIHGVYTAKQAADGTYVPTTHFLVNDPIVVVIPVRGLPKGEHHTVTVHYFYQGADLGLQNDSTQNLTLAVDGNMTLTFKINYSLPAVGMARVYWDLPKTDDGSSPKDPHIAATINFAVIQPTPTPKPSATATPKGGTTPSKTTPAATATKGG